MAQKVLVTITDDLDGSEGAETVRFSFEGQAYEIDLGPENRAKFMEMFSMYREHARRDKAPGASGGRPARLRDAGRSKDIRTWAKGQGLEVPDRGRIPGRITEQYDRRSLTAASAANGATTAAPPKSPPGRTSRARGSRAGAGAAAK